MTDRLENMALVMPGLLLLGLAFILPVLQMLVLSVSGPDGFTLEHFTRFLSDSYYLGILWRTVRLSALITLITALIGFPLAYIMAKSGPRLRLWLTLWHDPINVAGSGAGGAQFFHHSDRKRHCYRHGAGPTAVHDSVGSGRGDVD